MDEWRELALTQNASIRHMAEAIQTLNVPRNVTKPEDIPSLELHHLHGLDSTSRLNLFCEQVESRSVLSSERIKVVKMRVSVELALLLQSLTTKNPNFIWSDLMNLLRQEFAIEINFDCAWQQLDDLRYN